MTMGVESAPANSASLPGLDVDARRTPGQGDAEPVVVNLQRRAIPEPISKGSSAQKSRRGGVEFDRRGVNRVVDDRDHGLAVSEPGVGVNLIAYKQIDELAAPQGLEFVAQMGEFRDPREDCLLVRRAA